MPPNGGFAKFHSLGNEDSTVGAWLQSAGYRTGLMGKYLNGYLENGSGVDKTYVPPGWDEWDGAGNGYAEFNYQLNENGTLVSYGNKPEDYLVDVESRKATDFITGAAHDGKPFFLYLATFAPHQPATPAPRHENLFPGVQAPRTPSFNEPDVSDKPAWLQSRPTLRPAQIRQIDDLYRKRLQSLQSVDEMIASLVNTLRANGQLEETYIVFSSDNGFHLGQHRLPPGKQTAYDEDIRVPLIVRGPGVPSGETTPAIAMNIDLNPTFAKIGGAKIPDFVDGRSLLPLLSSGTAPAGWRTGAVVEHFGSANDPNDPDNDDAFLQGTAPGPNAGSRTGRRAGGQGGQQPAAQPRDITTYEALRTSAFLYVAYVSGEHELYSIADDPFELNNIYNSADPALIQKLDVQLKVVTTCSGDSCRVADHT
jgi:arylsulfatase A-like enzyme